VKNSSSLVLVWAASIGLSLALGGGVGFLVGTTRQNAASSLSVRQTAPLDAYLTEGSFSEIENTKEKLRALATQFLAELHARHDVDSLEPDASNFHGNRSFAIDPGRALTELEAGVGQFNGPNPETRLYQEWLSLLKKQGLTSRWLDVYLHFAYEHPTDPLIGRYAKEALVIGQSSGRQLEVANALDGIRRIPFDFPYKQQLVESLNGSNLARVAPDSQESLELPTAAGVDQPLPE
jgi:hypothetical protein